MDRRRHRFVAVFGFSGVLLAVVDLPDEIIDKIRRDRKVMPAAAGIGYDFLESREDLGKLELVFRIRHREGGLLPHHAAHAFRHRRYLPLILLHEFGLLLEHRALIGEPDVRRHGDVDRTGLTARYVRRIADGLLR